MSGHKIVLRVPESLKTKIERAAEAEGKLPTEWLRDLARAELADTDPAAEQRRTAAGGADGGS